MPKPRESNKLALTTRQAMADRVAKEMAKTASGKFVTAKQDGFNMSVFESISNMVFNLQEQLGKGALGMKQVKLLVRRLVKCTRQLHGDGPCVTDGVLC